MEVDKFIFKLKKKKCSPISFVNYFSNLNEIHKCNTIDKKPKVDIVIIQLIAILGENGLI